MAFCLILSLIGAGYGCAAVRVMAKYSFWDSYILQVRLWMRPRCRKLGVIGLPVGLGMYI
jgi:hypothetical protein